MVFISSYPVQVNIVLHGFHGAFFTFLGAVLAAFSLAVLGSRNLPMVWPQVVKPSNETISLEFASEA